MEQANVDKEFKDYRNFGVALSLTLISICSALIYWGKAIFLNEKPVACQNQVVSGAMLIFGALTVLSCVRIQFLNYQGYKEKARGTLKGDANPPASNVWFGKEDCAVNASLALFVITAVLAVLCFILTI